MYNLKLISIVIIVARYNEDSREVKLPKPFPNYHLPRIAPTSESIVYM